MLFVTAAKLFTAIGIIVTLFLLWYLNPAVFWLNYDTFWLAYEIACGHLYIYIRCQVIYGVWQFQVTYPQVWKFLVHLFHSTFWPCYEGWKGFKLYLEVLVEYLWEFVYLLADAFLILYAAIVFLGVFLHLAAWVCYFLDTIWSYLKTGKLFTDLELSFHITLGFLLAPWTQDIIIVALLIFVFRVTSYWPKVFNILVGSTLYIYITVDTINYLSTEGIVIGCTLLLLSFRSRNIINIAVNPTKQAELEKKAKVWFKKNLTVTAYIVERLWGSVGSTVILINFPYRSQLKLEAQTWRYIASFALLLLFISVHYVVNSPLLMLYLIISYTLFILVTFFSL